VLYILTGEYSVLAGLLIAYALDVIYDLPVTLPVRGVRDE